MDRPIEDADSRNLNLLVDDRKHSGLAPRQSHFVVYDILKMVADLLGGSDRLDAFFEIQGGDGAAGLQGLAFLLSPLLKFLKGEPAWFLILIFIWRFGPGGFWNNLLIFVSCEAALIAEVSHAALQAGK